MKYRLQDLIDIDRFQSLQDRLNDIYAFPSSILDNDGRILTATAWQEICTQFHRKNKDAEKICIQSDQYIKDHIHEANPALSYRCPHGLVDNATPIVIDGIHYGNFFTGQFFLEAPNLNFFRSQARKYGFDEEAYIKAVKKVPIWSPRQLNSYLLFIRELISVISESGLQKLKEIESRRQIQKSEQRYRSILKAAMDGYWRTDGEGRLLEVNDAYCRMSGYHEDELLTMGIADLEAVETPELVAQRMRGVMATESDRFESRHRRKDGTFFDVEVSIQVHSKEERQCVCFIRDITDHKQAQETLENERTFLSAVFDNIEDAIVICDAEGRLVRFNEAARRLHGLPEAPIPSKQWAEHYDLYASDGISPLAVEDIPLFRALSGERVQNAEIVVAPKHRGSHFLVCSGQALTDETGRPIGAVVAMHDITDRKRFEEELRDSEQMYRTTFDAIPDSITVTRRKDGRYRYVNDGFCSITGFSREEVIGKTPFDIDLYVHRTDRDRMTQTLRQNGELLNFEIPFRKKDGTTWDSFFSARPIVIDGEECLIALTKDVTEVKRAEEEKARLETQLRQAQKMESVGRLAGGVAHDFNNMLSVILGNTEMVLEQVDAKNPFHANLMEIQKAAERSADVTRQLLSFARKQIIAPKWLDLNETVANTLSMLRRLIGEDIELVWLPASDTGRIRMDPSQIDQILANLCVNARDAISGVGKIIIETRSVVIDEAYGKNHTESVPGPYALLEVSDSGAGMDAETLENLFEPFYTTKDVDKGTGLGLATVYGIVRQNNGFIHVNSKPNQGTSFKIYLPRPDPPGKQDSLTVSPQPEPSPGSETILLVEDEPAILTMTARMLERLGYHVLAAATPGEAIRMAREHSKDLHLLMTDVIMPEMNGRDLARSLMTIYPNLKRLFMSGYTADVIAHHGVLDEGVNFIQKPFSKQALSLKIRKALDEWPPEKSEKAFRK